MHECLLNILIIKPKKAYTWNKELLNFNKMKANSPILKAGKRYKHTFDKRRHMDGQ
jgi:hypothetical protein